MEACILLTINIRQVIEDADFVFENTPIRIIANRNCPKIELVGLNIGELEEGNEYRLKFWIAHELENKGIVRIQEDERLSMKKLSKICYGERTESVKTLSQLMSDFYPRLRRYLLRLEKGSMKYHRASRFSQDLVNSRLKKIVSLASAPAQTKLSLEKLTREELVLYRRLYRIIKEWRRNIIGIRANP